MAFSYYDSDRARDPWRVVPDLVRARWLLFELARKDLRVRYRYAVMGFLWAVLEPVALMLILTFVFSYVLQARLAGVAADGGPPFAVFVLSGLIFWQFFATALNSATHSLLENQNLVQKVRFPREILPLAALGFPFVNVCIGAVLLLLLHVALGGALAPALLALPAVLAIQVALMAGLGMMLACGHVLFRDIGYMTSVALIFGFYASPIFYATELVRNQLPGWAFAVYSLNPMVGLLTAYRQMLFDGCLPDPVVLAWPAVLSVLCLAGGFWLCRRKGPVLSDYM